MIMPSEPTATASALRTRSSLLFRLRNWEDSRSWEEFYNLYRKLVYGYARKSGLSHEEAEEVTNDVFVRVANTIHEFESNPEKGPFRGWLLNLARWRVTDKFRSRGVDRLAAHGDGGGDDKTATVERIPDAAFDDRLWDKEWQESLVGAAMERLARRTNAKHFQIFELHMRQQWPVLRLSRELGVNAAGVYLITHRLTKQLKQEVAAIRATLD
jgi:RNA polymerase sigma factor (sigma-70 family)